MALCLAKTSASCHGAGCTVQQVLESQEQGVTTRTMFLESVQLGYVSED